MCGKTNPISFSLLYNAEPDEGKSNEIPTETGYEPGLAFTRKSHCCFSESE